MMLEAPAADGVVWQQQMVVPRAAKGNLGVEAMKMCNAAGLAQYILDCVVTITEAIMKACSKADCDARLE